MKLIIQIPCYQESEVLPTTVADLPQDIPGIDSLETLVIDDGSSDNTAGVARALGVDHVVRHPRNLGLARAFHTGLETCLQLGADIIVNTDADHQYPGHFIPDLVAPVLAGEAEITIGNRQVDEIDNFSGTKKRLQRLGSWLVRTVSGTDVPDAPSGFRAYSREAALRMNSVTRYSYTLETIIQAGKLGLPIASVPVTTNPPLRPSRLQRSMWHFIKAQASTIVRLYAFYEPLRTFGYIALPFLVSGLGLMLRFLVYYLLGERGVGRFVQSLTLGTGLFLVGLIIFVFGVQADIASSHRQLTQDMLYRLKKMELAQQNLKKKSDQMRQPH